MRPTWPAVAWPGRLVRAPSPRSSLHLRSVQRPIVAGEDRTGWTVECSNCIARRSHNVTALPYTSPAFSRGNASYPEAALQRYRAGDCHFGGHMQSLHDSVVSERFVAGSTTQFLSKAPIAARSTRHLTCRNTRIACTQRRPCKDHLLPVEASMHPSSCQ